MAIDYLSELTTAFSNVSASRTSLGETSVTGGVTLSGAVSATSGTFSGRVAVGGGTPIVFVSASSTSLAAITATATKSTTTTFTNNLAAVGDIVSWGLGTSTSSLSPGLALNMYVSAASTIEIRLSNVSAANAAQPAISLTYMIQRMVW